MSMFGHIPTFTASNEWKMIDIIESPDANIEQLLDDESIVSIARSNNQKLMEFILRPKNFHQLISYLITEPEEIIRPTGRHNQTTQQSKLPFIACELLSSDVDSITNKLLENPVLMQTDTDTIPDESPPNSDSESKNENFSSELKQLNSFGSNTMATFPDSEDANNSKGKNDKEMDKEKKSNHLIPNHPILQQMKSELTEQSPDKAYYFGTANSLEEDLEEDIIPCPMEYILNFFSNKPPLNPTMCGYVSKLLKNLYTNKPVQLANLLFETLFPQFKKILNHLYNDSLSDLLQLLIKMETLISSDTVQGARRTEIILMLANGFATPIYRIPLTEDYAQDYLENISSIFSAWFGSFKQINGGSKILKPLLKSIYITPLVFIIKTASNGQLKAISRYICSYCVFLKELIAAEETDTLQDSPLTISNQIDSLVVNVGSNAGKSTSNNAESVTNYEPIFAELSKIAECALKILHENRQYEHSVTFPAGYSSNLIGHKRYYLYEMLTAILKLDGEAFEKKIIDSEFYEISLEILEQNCWGNILHGMIYKTLEFVIESRWYEMSKAALINKADLIGFILKETKNPYYKHPSKTGATVVKGHIAFLMKLANLLQKSEDERIRRFIKENASYSKWEEWVETELRSYNKRNNTKLGGLDPKASMSPDRARLLKETENAMLNEIENAKDDSDEEEQQDDGEHHKYDPMMIEKEATQELNGHIEPEKPSIKEFGDNQMQPEENFDSHMETKFLSPDLWHDGGERVITEKNNRSDGPETFENPASNINPLFRNIMQDPLEFESKKK